MSYSERQLLHREAESIKEAIRQAESLVILSVDSIRLHAIPEMQNVGDALETLFDSLYNAGREAKVLENTLYRGYVENGNQCVVATSEEDLEGLS